MHLKPSLLSLHLQKQHGSGLFIMKSSSTIPLCELQSWFLSRTGVIDQLHLGLANERLCSSGESIGGSRASSFSITSEISHRGGCWFCLHQWWSTKSQCPQQGRCSKRMGMGYSIFFRVSLGWNPPPTHPPRASLPEGRDWACFVRFCGPRT